MNAPSSMLRGLMRDPDARECVVCHQQGTGEDLPHGECVCDSCMRDVIECPRCEGWFRRAEFLTPAGLSTNCADCDYQLDQWELAHGARP